MHPARQAYVEEDDPEVSSFLLLNALVMFIRFQRNAGLHMEASIELPMAQGMPADGWVEVIGHGDGGGPCKHTWAIFSRVYFSYD